MKVFNTLSGQKEEFSPQGTEVKMYVCGITPYDDSHIGHAMSYIVFDAIRRYLQFRGYKVKYVQNITDIDDKIIDRANQLGISTHELAAKYTNSYFEDMDALNIGRADIYPRATEEIPKIIEIIQGLIDKGYAYAAQGSVYFRIKNVPDYGKLSHRNLGSIIAAEGAMSSEDKESPMDFVLWKAAKPGEPSWTSPWGEGRPGWHIECSAMSLKYLGNTLDIHGGGQDLVFPHHENEITQSESFTGVKPFVKYWLHNGLVRLGEEKMSKSLGNLITIKEALSRYGADDIRIFILHSHYSSPLTYDETTLDAAGVALRAFSNAKWKLSERYAEMNRSMLETQSIKTDNITPAEEYHNRFISAMDDDFNTAQAIATLFNLAQEINRSVNLGHEDKIVEHRKIFKELAGVLGLILPEPENKELKIDVQSLRQLLFSINERLLEADLKELPVTEMPDEAEALLEFIILSRTVLRKKKEWQNADKIRDKLDELGIILEDTPQGTAWKCKP